MCRAAEPASAVPLQDETEWRNVAPRNFRQQTALLAEVLEQGPYDVVHFNMGLHGWQEGRIKPGTFRPLTRAYVEVIRNKLPEAKIIWASSTPVTVKGKPTELDPAINPVIVEHNRMAAKVMQGDDAESLGKLMDESHASLHDDFEVTNEELDIMARTTQAQPGCYGARMTGGGFGGCAVALVRADLADEIATAVARQYQIVTGLKPEVFSTPAAAGTAVIPD